MQDLVSANMRIREMMMTVSSAMAATTSDYSAYSHGHGSKSGKSAKVR